MSDQQESTSRPAAVGIVPPRAGAGSERANILMVDDQPARLLSYEAILTGLNVRCVRALSGFEALEKLLALDFAAILLDVNMPGMDGFELARLIREHPRLERTPIIFITGVHVSELDQLRGYEVGAIDYMSVPVVPEILRSKVAVLVELHQRRSELREINSALSHARDSLTNSAADVTGLKQAEAALRDSEQRLMLAKKAAKLGTHDWDIRADTIEWDERTRELWGLTPTERVGFEVFKAGVHPEDWPATQRAVDAARDPAGDGQYLALYRVINRVDGLERWIEATGRAYFENGVPVRLVGMVQDVTDRTLSAARLQQSEARLRELDRRKDEFLSMLAHELRNPVAPIRNAAEALCILQLPDQRQRSLVEIIKRQVAQLTRLLDDLLDVARITQGRIELRLERVSISSCLEIAVEMTQPLIREKGHRLSVTQSVAPLYIHADRVRIAQCITNMLLNAAKYTEESGEIRVHVSSDAEAAVVEITDTGIGIASEFLPRAFDLFAQGDRTIDRSQGGLGVGLSVCKQLIEMHGGTVSALSAGLGKGSTFVIRIPLVS